MTHCHRVLFSLLLLIGTTRFSFAQSEEDRLDRWVSNAATHSEKALFEALFDEALLFVDISYFKKFPAFQPYLEIQLMVQKDRVEGFRNLLFQIKRDPTTRLQELLKLKSSADSLTQKGLKADYLLMLSSAYRSVGKRDTSELLENKAVQLFTELRDSKKVGEIRANQISRRHNRLLAEGNFEGIIDMIPEYLKEITFSSVHSKYALAYNTRHLGQIHRRQTGELQKALELFQESLKLREEIGFKPFIPASYSSIGDVYLAMKQYDKATKAYQTSLHLAKEIGFIRYQLYPPIQIGDIYFKLGDFINAKKHYQVALTNAIKYENEVGIVQAQEKLGQLE